MLTNRHLNQVFDYLDEQERLTRANLIGIGIVCGLEVSLGGTAAAPEVHISRGCGVTSEGYLIVEPKGLALVSYKEYTPPPDVEYPLLTPPPTGFKVWEMFEEGEPKAYLFSTDPTFLNDKVVLLFLELKKDSLRNCSPTNCDDKGAEVTVRVRRLLVSKADQKKVLSLLDGTLDPAKQLLLDDYERELLLELNLPDLRLPRYDVPAGPLSSSNVILAGFFTAIKKANLANHLGNALTAAHNAFFPVLKEVYPTNPFIHFNDINRYGFLNSAPTNVAQVRFLQYYYDLFDDLIKAYDEFRWKGAELMCACCPPSELFPRHLVLSLAHPELDSGAAIYRHYFQASSAISGCEKHTEELQMLFRRLVEMTERFTNDPPLLRNRINSNSSLIPHIRITPSKLGDVPVSAKCIPYYYLQDGTPRLFQLWNPEKTQRKKPHHNLSYQSYQYGVSLPNFVANPLLYDLEPNNFLRIEGHLGEQVTPVLTTLINLRNQYRLPIDIIALRTGAFDEKMVVDPSKEYCRFEDLEALYDATREQWLGFLCKELTYLYGLEAYPPTSPNPDRKFFKSKFPFINRFAPGFLVDPHKLGGHYETGSGQSGRLPSNIAKIKPGTIVFDALFYDLFDHILTLASSLPDDLKAFKYTTFEARHKSLQERVAALETDREVAVSNADQQSDLGISHTDLLAWEEIDDRLEDLMYFCRTEALKSIQSEYARRFKEVQQKQFLTNFLLKHPGIQHKAGVPVGGTFIVVYHDDPEIIRPVPDSTASALPVASAQRISPELLEEDELLAAHTGQSAIFTKEFEEAFVTLQTDEKFAQNKYFQTIVEKISGQRLSQEHNIDFFLNDNANRIIAQYVNGLTDGTVIADFFLPYLCCSDCAGVQFVLAQAPLTFAFTIGCTNANNQAEVSIKPQGGAPPYSYRTADTLAYRPLAGVAVLDAGPHTLTVRDSQGTESAPQSIEIKSKITLGAPDYTCRPDGKFYKVSFLISGGTEPYTPNRGNVAANGQYTSDELPSGIANEIAITDSKGCKETLIDDHRCPAPLDFTVTPTCTGEDNHSPSTIEVTGGTPDFQIKIGEERGYALLTKPHKLPAGKYTVTIRDAQDVELSQPVDIPEQLKAVVLPADYKCLEGRPMYQALVRISGGTPPYKVEGKTIKDDQFVTHAFDSGFRTALKITDDAGCETTASIFHECPKPCDKPCAGISQKCSYRLWVQPGPPPFEIYNPYKVEFTFTDEKGTVTPIQWLPVTVPPEFFNRDFHGTMKAIIDQLNAHVAKTLGIGRVVLSYDPNDADPFARLWIETFQCEMFSMKFRYDYAQGGQVEGYEAHYLKDGKTNAARFVNLPDPEPIEVPAFDCSVRDQCKDTPAEKVCKEKTPQIDMEAVSSGDQITLTASFSAGPTLAPISWWFWEVSGSTDALYTGRQVSAKVPNLGRTGTTVKLTGITRTGCFVSIRRVIPAVGTDPKLPKHT